MAYSVAGAIKQVEASVSKEIEGLEATDGSTVLAPFERNLYQGTSMIVALTDFRVRVFGVAG